MKRGGDCSLGEKEKSRTSSRIEQFSFTEDQWNQVERGSSSTLMGRRSRTAGREKFEGESDVLVKSNRGGWENRLGGLGCTEKKLHHG